MRKIGTPSFHLCEEQKKACETGQKKNEADKPQGNVRQVPASGVEGPRKKQITQNDSDNARFHD